MAVVSYHDSVPTLTPIVPGLELLEAEGGARFPYSHSFVVRGEVDALIDAGCGIERLLSVRRSWKPDVVILSHAHPDHCAGAWVFEDARILSPEQHRESFWRFDALSRRFTEAGELADSWIDYVSRFTGAREVSADAHYSHGQSLDFGAITLECVHAPGHTEDHFVLFEPRHGVALVFDIDLTSFGPWYGHRESDIDAFLASIRAVGALEPRVVVSSHKGIVDEDIPARLAAYAAVIDEREARILELLGAPLRVADLVDRSPIYGGHPYAQALLRYWEGQMVAKHLDRMATRGQVVDDGGVWRRRR